MGAGAPVESHRALLAAREEQAPARRYSAKAVATRGGLPDEVLRAVEKAGLAEAEAAADGASAYTEADVQIAAGAMKLLEYGFPVTKLIRLAVRYDRAVRKTVDEAIDLFDEHVRKADASPEGERMADAFRELLPATTALVAHHFQRRLVNRATRRLKRSGRRRDLGKALEAASAARLKLRW